jgi:hypothetical protein
MDIDEEAVSKEVEKFARKRMATQKKLRVNDQYDLR